MASELKEASHIIEQFIANKNAQLSITIQTGHDEAGLVGTRDAYLRLAKTAIDFIIAAERDELERWHVFGRQLAASVLINDVFDSSCEVILDTTCLTNSEQETQYVSDCFKLGSPRGEQHFT